MHSAEVFPPTVGRSFKSLSFFSLLENLVNGSAALSENKIDVTDAHKLAVTSEYFQNKMVLFSLLLIFFRNLAHCFSSIIHCVSLFFII